MWPLIEVAIELKSETDRDALNAVLAQLVAEDPSFATSVDWESGQTLLHGATEGDLGCKLDRLIVDYGFALNVGAAQVAYRETITRRVEIDYSHKKAFGGKGEFARVRLVFKPGAPNSGFVFTSTVHPEVLPEPYIAGVAAGLEANRVHGLLARFPVIDMKATLVDGAYHDLDSSALAFDIAARFAFNALRDKAEPVLLEPIMAVEVSAPQACLAAIHSDLSGRRAEVKLHGALVTGLAPLASLIGYDRRLDRLTDGRGEWSMVFDHYAPVPQSSSPDDAFPPAVGMRA